MKTMRSRGVRLAVPAVAALLLGGCNDGTFEDLALAETAPDAPGEPPSLDLRDGEDGDDDGDGFSDEDDHLPCATYLLEVANRHVSSASVVLNGEEIVPPSFFPTPAVYRGPINVHVGVNVLTLGGRLAGSPEDELRLTVLDGDEAIVFEAVLVREKGRPTTAEMSFEIDAACE